MSFKLSHGSLLLGTGIDMVANKRFTYFLEENHPVRLRKIFTEKELALYESLFNPQHAHESPIPYRQKLSYIASRFAAKEAFYKALSSTLVRLGKTNVPFSFLFTCQHISIVKQTWGLPSIEVDWHAFENKIGTTLPFLTSHLSLSHEQEYAIASVCLTKEPE